MFSSQKQLDVEVGTACYYLNWLQFSKIIELLNRLNSNLGIRHRISQEQLRNCAQGRAIVESTIEPEWSFESRKILRDVWHCYNGILGDLDRILPLSKSEIQLIFPKSMPLTIGRKAQNDFLSDEEWDRIEETLSSTISVIQQWQTRETQDF